MDWTRQRLSAAELGYLKALPDTAPFGNGWLAAHGSPRDTDEYLFDALGFEVAFDYLRRLRPDVRGCFVGHTHLPMIWACSSEGRVVQVGAESRTVTLDPTCRYVVNPGSVGQAARRQPRWRPTRSWTRRRPTVEFRRISYDVAAAQEKIHDAMLPPMLAERLAIGR